MVNHGFHFRFFYMEELITIGNVFLRYKYINKIKLQIIDIQTFKVIKHTQTYACILGFWHYNGASGFLPLAPAPLT